MIVACIGCGCTEDVACVELPTAEPCGWWRFDMDVRREDRALCTACAPQWIRAWNIGQRGDLDCPRCGERLGASYGVLARRVLEAGESKCEHCGAQLAITGHRAGMRGVHVERDVLWNEPGEAFVLLERAADHVRQQHLLCGRPAA